jgi:hypothetical protein
MLKMVLFIIMPTLKLIKFKKIIKQNIIEKLKPMTILLNQQIKKENTDNKWKEKTYL